MREEEEEGKEKREENNFIEFHPTFSISTLHSPVMRIRETEKTSSDLSLRITDER
jgi:hypothetical protein